MEQLRLTRVVETPSIKQKEKLNHNKNLKSAGKYENLWWLGRKVRTILDMQISRRCAFINSFFHETFITSFA